MTYRYCRFNGKVRYRTHTIALLALVDVVFDLEGISKPGAKKPCRTYRCPVCGAWHLTSEPWEQSEEYLRSTANRVVSTQVSGTPRSQKEYHNGTTR